MAGLSEGWKKNEIISWHYISRDKRITADVDQDFDTNTWIYRVILWRDLTKLDDIMDSRRQSVGTMDLALEEADRLIRVYRRELERMTEQAGG